MEIASPGLPGFDYVRPSSIDEASALLLKHSGEARLFMGGTDLFVRMRDGALAPQLLIDVKHLPGMTDIHFDPRAGLRVSAAVDMNTIARHPAVIEHYPLLVEAISTVASYQLRSRATLGGNLCNASPAADTAPAVLVFEARVVACGPEGERTIPAVEFFLGPGKHALKPGELVVRIEFPIPPTGSTGCYLKLGRNTAGDLAIAGAAVLAHLDKAAPSGCRFRIALASVAPTPLRVPSAEAALAQGPLNDSCLDAAADLACDAARPISDLRASADYRRAMVRTLTRRALKYVWSALQKEAVL